jgi:hypothetical protein
MLATPATFGMIATGPLTAPGSMTQPAAKSGTASDFAHRRAVYGDRGARAEIIDWLLQKNSGRLCACGDRGHYRSMP